MTPRAWIGVILLNVALAGAMQAIAPAQPTNTDRTAYEDAGRFFLSPQCKDTIYCYRVLVPVLLERVPIDPERRWRLYQFAANSAAGIVLAAAVSHVTPGLHAALLATLMVQTSFGFGFTAYDPYTADPLVFLIAALLALCWVRDWPIAALVIAPIGVFAKETVVLLAGACALAAILSPGKHGRHLWVAQGVVAATVLLGFHFVMDTFAGWGIRGNVASNFSEGSWLAIWWRSNPSLISKAYMIFIPFGFAWFFALAGWRVSGRVWRHLALGAILPMFALVYVQTPERALGNAFFALVPLATAFLATLPLTAAYLAVITNGLLTAKVGLSTPWLPASSILIVPAAVSAAWVLWLTWRRIPQLPNHPRRQ